MKSIEFNYRVLRGKIREVFGTEKNFAHAIGMNPSTLSLKLSNKLEFTQQDIISAMNALSVGNNSIGIYFFTPEVAIAQLQEHENKEK